MGFLIFLQLGFLTVSLTLCFGFGIRYIVVKKKERALYALNTSNRGVPIQTRKRTIPKTIDQKKQHQLSPAPSPVRPRSLVFSPMENTSVFVSQQRAFQKHQAQDYLSKDISQRRLKNNLVEPQPLSHSNLRTSGYFNTSKNNSLRLSNSLANQKMYSMDFEEETQTQPNPSQPPHTQAALAEPKELTETEKKNLEKREKINEIKKKIKQKEGEKHNTDQMVVEVNPTALKKNRDTNALDYPKKKIKPDSHKRRPDPSPPNNKHSKLKTQRVSDDSQDHFLPTTRAYKREEPDNHDDEEEFLTKNYRKNPKLEDEDDPENNDPDQEFLTDSSESWRQQFFTFAPSGDPRNSPKNTSSPATSKKPNMKVSKKLKPNTKSASKLKEKKRIAEEKKEEKEKVVPKKSEILGLKEPQADTPQDPGYTENGLPALFKIQKQNLEKDPKSYLLRVNFSNTPAKPNSHHVKLTNSKFGHLPLEEKEEDADTRVQTLLLRASQHQNLLEENNKKREAEDKKTEEDRKKTDEDQKSFSSFAPPSTTTDKNDSKAPTSFTSPASSAATDKRG